jgi:hypothetical protein
VSKEKEKLWLPEKNSSRDWQTKNDSRIKRLIVNNFPKPE